MSDRYEEAARGLCAIHRVTGARDPNSLPSGVGCACKEVAAFGRQCAREAYQEAIELCLTRSANHMRGSHRVELQHAADAIATLKKDVDP